jgi:hypothetical protein
MPKCITCGAEATFTYFKRQDPELCIWCATNLPTEIYFLACGISGIKEYIVLPHQVRSGIYEGIWNSFNWMNYPNLVERRKEVQLQFLSKFETVVIKNKEDRYPHKCPKCGSPAYVGFASLDCSKGCK